MSAARWLAAGALDGLLAAWAGEGSLLAPTMLDGEVLFLPVTDPARIARDYVNSLVPPKTYFLPTPERLVGYRIADGVPALEPDPPADEPARVLFGIRSCDVAGLAYLERYFAGACFARPDLADAAFLRRREATTLVSVVCETPGPHCMCVCGHGGPALARDFDWQLTRLDGGWLVEIGSARGERLAARHAAALGDPPHGAARAREERVRATVARFHAASPRRVPSMAASRMISAGRLAPAFWKSVGDRCFECGGCAFVCPTCWCFNVAEVCEAGGSLFYESAEGMSPTAPGALTGHAHDGAWQRVRLRDSCVFPGYLRQAGGGYPRWTTGERCQTRFFHKLSQQFRDRVGAPGCTGCGRCAQVCLGEQGIDRIAESMRDALVRPAAGRKAAASIPDEEDGA